MKQGMARGAARTLILLGSAIIVFGCKAPLQDNTRGIDMTTTAQKRAVEDILPKKVEGKIAKDAETPVKEEAKEGEKKKITLEPVKDREKPRKPMQHL